MSGLILVVDDDVDVARFIELNLELEGFTVKVVHTGEDALAAVHERVPDLVLLDTLLPGIDGFEVCRRLRLDPLTMNLPVLLLTANQVGPDRVVGLAAGADDYIVKPFDTLELIARVRFTMRRNAEMRALSPLTGLPGNQRIELELAQRIALGLPLAVCYADLDNFKAFNDAYGFLRGDDCITLLSTAVKTAAAETGSPPPFVGHVGGDDFVVVCTPEQVEPMCSRILSIFDAAVPQLHDAADVARGFVAVVDRQGHVREYPLVSVSIGVATNERRHFRDHREAVAIATEMKTVAKAQPGSAIAIDRRSDPAAVPHA